MHEIAGAGSLKLLPVGHRSMSYLSYEILKSSTKKKQMFFSSATNITWLSVWLLEMSHVD